MLFSESLLVLDDTSPYYFLYYQTPSGLHDAKSLSIEVPGYPQPWDILPGAIENPVALMTLDDLTTGLISRPVLVLTTTIIGILSFVDEDKYHLLTTKANEFLEGAVRFISNFRVPTQEAKNRQELEEMKLPSPNFELFKRLSLLMANEAAAGDIFYNEEIQEKAVTKSGYRLYEVTRLPA